MKDLLSSYKLCAARKNQPFLTAESMAVNTWRRGWRDGTGISVVFPWQPFSQSLRDRPQAGVGASWQPREALTKDAGGTSRNEDGGRGGCRKYWSAVISSLDPYADLISEEIIEDGVERRRRTNTASFLLLRGKYLHLWSQFLDGSWCYLLFFLSPTAFREVFERPRQSKLAGSNIKPRAKCSLTLRSPWFQRTEIAGISKRVGINNQLFDQ